MVVAEINGGDDHVRRGRRVAPRVEAVVGIVTKSHARSRRQPAITGGELSGARVEVDGVVAIVPLATGTGIVAASATHFGLIGSADVSGCSEDSDAKTCRHRQSPQQFPERFPHWPMKSFDDNRSTMALDSHRGGRIILPQNPACLYPPALRCPGNRSCAFRLGTEELCWRVLS
jgi:hypothetical protein